MNLGELDGIDVNIEEIQYIIKKYRSGESVIVVTGEFNSGKSSFINCFLNKKEFLPYGKTECTPVLIDICEGEEGKIEIRKNDGTIFMAENTNENITKYAKYSENTKTDIVSIGIPLLGSGLPQGTHLIDTPGTNTIIKKHEEITKYVVKKADAVLYLFNKIISKSDISHIKEILEITSNIIFVLTHSDELDSKTGRKYTKQRIGELINEAKKEISAGTAIDIDDLIVCSVGSADGFENRDEIDEINTLISDYVKTQTEERRKRIAQKKIKNILQSSLDNYSIMNELLKKQKALDDATLEKKIKKFESEQSKREKAHNNRIENINRRINQQEEICRSELSRLLTEEKNEIILLISSADAEEKLIENKVNRLNSVISAKMRNIIEESLISITREAYESANSSLESINSEFDIDVPLMLTTPDIKELDDSRIIARLSSVEKQIEDNLRELEALKENSTESDIQEIEKQIRACEVQKEAVSDKILQLGAYRPEFVTVENVGGSDIGRVTGRVIGEVADLAFLIWNPAGAAAGAAKGAGEAAKVVKAADKAKDAAMIFRYLKTAASKAAETEKKINEKKEKVVTTIKKVDDGRREIINRVQKNCEESEKDCDTLSTMLDMLSIGHWTEKLGGVIGETIKPTITTSIEDLDAKETYQSKRNELTEESHHLSNEIYILKNQLCEIDDFGKQRRIEAEIREINKALEEKKVQLEEMRKGFEKQNADEQVKTHLKTQFEQYEYNQYEKGVRLIQAILSEAKIKIIERVTTDYCEKLDYYKDAVAGLKEGTITNMSGIVECENRMAALSRCLSEVRTWFE